MRIAYLLESTELFGGVKVAMAQAEALARRGHHVTIVSPDGSPCWFSLTRAHFERSSFRESAALASADVRVATFFTTVAPALSDFPGPVFHLCQGYEGEIGFYRERSGEIAEIYRAPTRKLTVSATLAERLTRLGFGPAVNVGQAFDGSEFTPGPARPASSPPVVLVVGPLEIDFKGVDVALQGLALWKEQGGRFRLRRVSYFPPGEAERRFALADEYHHRVPPGRMPFVYRASDLFLGASRLEEGFGLPTLEAIACGVPCVLSDTPGQREIAGEAARYFRDGDARALAETIPGALTPEFLSHARLAGPAAAARFDTATVAAKLEEEFLGALEG